MNKTFSFLIVLLFFLASAGCAPNDANAFKSHVSKKLDALGCDYKMGDVEVRNIEMQDGTVLGREITVHFYLKSPNEPGEYLGRIIKFTLSPKENFDEADPSLESNDRALEFVTRDCVKRDS